MTISVLASFPSSPQSYPQPLVPCTGRRMALLCLVLCATTSVNRSPSDAGKDSLPPAQMSDVWQVPADWPNGLDFPLASVSPSSIFVIHIPAVQCALQDLIST